MAGAFTAVDLALLPFPDAIESLDYETILTAMLADLQVRDPLFSALVESDPAFKIMEVCAYRELLLRQRVNEAVKAVTLAYAEKADLEQIAARYDVQRLQLLAEDLDTTPATAALFEDDDSLRRRVQLSFEGFSTAGPEGAYVFHALGADADVLDVAVSSPAPGVVSVAVLSRAGDGTPSPQLLAAVDATLSADKVRPLTDNLNVVPGNIINYSVTASLVLFDGPDASVVIATARAAMQAYANASHRLGRDLTLSGVYAALHQPGVQRVVLATPAANIVTAWNQAAYCGGISLSLGGADA
jgi:phage-related baseplate assembly protein